MTTLNHAELVAAATIGTGTRPVERRSLPGPVADVAAADAGASLVLDAAAAYAVTRRARIPEPGPLELVPLPEDGRSLVSPAFASLARRLVGGAADERVILADALRALAQRNGSGLRLPSALLVEIMSTPPGAGTPKVWAALADVLGPADAALAALNPAWERALARHAGPSTSEPVTVDTDVWRTGTHAERLAVVSALRQSDPARATELLTDGSLAREPVGHRVDMVQAMAVGLSAADEDVLTTWLSDRAKSVRAAAADLLGRIPGSATARLAEEQALAHLQVHRETPRKGALSRLLGRGQAAPVITVQARGVEADPELSRRGIDGDNRRHRLAAVISHVPSQRWPELVGATAVELLWAPIEIDGLGDNLAKAWVESAARWQDPELALDLLDGWGIIVDGMETFVDAERLEHALARALRVRRDRAAAAVLAHLPEHLSAATASAVVGMIPVWARAKTGTLPADATAILVARAPLEAAADLAERLSELNTQLEDPQWLQRPLGLLRLRAAIPDALTSCPDPTT